MNRITHRFLALLQPQQVLQEPHSVNQPLVGIAETMHAQHVIINPSPSSIPSPRGQKFKNGF